MSQWRYELSEPELRTAFLERVRPSLFGGRTPEDDPVLVLVGAQPAAGKTAAIARLQQAYTTHDPVAVTGDDLRVYHPDYLTSLAVDPLEMPNITAASSGRWVRDAIDYAAGQQISVIIEGTFRDPDTTLGTAQRFVDAGFRTHLVALAVPGHVSRLDAVHRYFGAVATGEPGRWSPLINQDLGYTGVPTTVERAEQSPAVHRLTVVDRAGALWFDNSRGRDAEWIGPTGAVTAVERAREKSPAPEAARQWIERLQQNLDWAREAGQLTAATLPNFQRLVEQDAPMVLRHAHPEPEAAARQAAEHTLGAALVELTERQRTLQPGTERGLRPGRDAGRELGDDGPGLG